ncbi:hypothetical protein LVJ94_25735 [Pendulispora rubella]|uniref:Uncharacterized protein n=1 Tax=Pendulispora rubella TaxID=2741070 RepID=A0ABZ2LJP7_9BACT
MGAYLRASAPERAERELSLPAQRRAVQEYAAPERALDQPRPIGTVKLEFIRMVTLWWTYAVPIRVMRWSQ